MATPCRIRRLLVLLAAVAVAASHPAHEFCAAAGGGGGGAGGCGGGGDGTRILIKGGTMVNAHRAEEADVYIEDGVVVAVRPNIPVGDDNVKVIDATGKYVMPGGIDPHTHLEMEFMGTVTIDDFYSGHAAALAGGTTMHIDFVIPVNGNLTAGLESYKHKAEKSAMDYGFHMAITKWNDEVSREMEVMVKEHGINSFKFFMAYKGSLMVTDDLLLQGLQKCKSLGALAMVHAENGDAVAEGQQRMIDLGITGPEGHALSRPPVLEGEATSRAIRLAKFVNTPLYVVHVMSPPIREAGHNKALQAALSSGILQLVGTDHCTFNSTQKAFGSDDFRKIPNGVNGIEERMHIIWDSMVETGKITVTDYVRVTSTECAKIFNIYPRKGAILEGSDADIIVLNPKRSFAMGTRTHHTRSDTNVYEGRKGKGMVEVTISRGRVVWEDGNLNAVPGAGRYVRTPPFGYLFDGLDKSDAVYRASLRAPVQRGEAAAAAA
ncbi:unnamed protein product [Triticum turgidum subsp. durum]|uniref:dihydropyrimidinase n=1 Tax=Triticum turgidum subsp. durum TaxID=4567 RepID=A0A9R0RRW3_TRITD|nr:unnamed protein product [Triticum turgidum subsp. durum]